jgi:tetratricopeptide (TPR) repeat protein
MNIRRTPLTVAALFAGAMLVIGAESPKLETYPPEYRKALVEMAKLFTERDFPATLEAIDKLEKMAPPNAHTVNTRAAVMIEQHNFEEGRRLCQEALKLDPKYYPARFNLGEIPLMEKKYPEARAIFQTLLNANPRDELAQFRIFLTYLLEKNDTAAREILGKLKFPSDTPAFYYANAAWEFTRGNVADGKAWVERGNWVFGKEKASNFAESLIQLGWIERPAPVPRNPVVSTPELTEPTAAKAGEIAKPGVQLTVPTEAPGLGAPTKLNDVKPAAK